MAGYKNYKGNCSRRSNFKCFWCWDICIYANKNRSRCGKSSRGFEKNRQNIRSQFNSVANKLEDFGNQYIKNNINRPLENPIADLDRNIQDIRNTRLDRSKNCRILEKLQEDCRILIRDIHSESNIEND